MTAWIKINDLAQEFGAWVVSEPNSPLRLECMDFKLPWRLASMGYDIASMGTNDRLIPMAGGAGPGVVLVFQIDLPLGRPVATSAIL